MRLFVVLALVAFTGCQANVPRSEEPKPQLDMVKDAFWEYFAKATNTAQYTLKTIRESEFSQQVNTKIKDSVKVARQYTDIVQDLVSIVGQESYNKVSEQVDRLSERLEPDLKEVRAQLEPYAEQLRANIEQQVEKLRQEMAPYTESLDTEALKATLLQKRRELMDTLEWSVTELPTLLGPSTKELQESLEQRLQEFQKSVTPLADSLGSEMFQRGYKLKQTLKPYVDDVTKKLDPYTKELDSWLTSLWESFTKSV